jgi:hypothetical protein
MRTVRNITVAVDPGLYRQTRRLAAEYNTSVTDRLRFLLLAMPGALKAARYPGGRPQFGIAAAHAARAAYAAETPVQLTAAPSATSANIQAPETQITARPNSSTNSFPASRLGPSAHLFPSNANPSCETVKHTQTTCFQPLAALQSVLILFLYFSTALITNSLRASTSIILHEWATSIPWILPPWCY